MDLPIAKPREKQASPNDATASNVSSVSIWHPSFLFQSGGSIMLLLFAPATSGLITVVDIGRDKTHQFIATRHIKMYNQI